MLAPDSDRCPQRCFFHLLAQTQRPHVGPHLLDMGQALFLRAAFAGVVPAKRVLAISWPDGVLLFVVLYNFVDGCILCFVSIHVSLLFIGVMA
jgi:hypothetical protein